MSLQCLFYMLGLSSQYLNFSQYENLIQGTVQSGRHPNQLIWEVHTPCVMMIYAQNMEVLRGSFFKITV